MNNEQTSALIEEVMNRSMSCLGEEMMNLHDTTRTVGDLVRVEPFKVLMDNIEKLEELKEYFLQRERRMM